MGRRRLPDPPWKSGPKEPKPSAKEHAIAPEDFGYGHSDLDGFGRDEAEMVEGEPLVVVMESATCARDGCDARHTRRLLFTTHTLTEEEESRLREQADFSTDEALAEHVWQHAERVDADTIEVNGIGITHEKIIDNEPYGPCYGRVEPEPDVHAHRYDL